jgi:hypothetical protein
MITQFPGKGNAPLVMCSTYGSTLSSMRFASRIKIVCRCSRSVYLSTYCVSIMVLRIIYSTPIPSQDMANALAAIAVLRMTRKAHMTLILLLPTSKVSVQNLGLDRRDIISLTELKTDFMALSCRLEGSMSFVANLFRDLTEEESERICRNMPYSIWKKSSR